MVCEADKFSGESCCEECTLRDRERRRRDIASFVCLLGSTTLPFPFLPALEMRNHAYPIFQVDLHKSIKVVRVEGCQNWDSIGALKTCPKSLAPRRMCRIKRDVEHTSPSLISECKRSE
jgi:hypothetical protein